MNGLDDDPDWWAFPDEDHRFTLGIHPGDAAVFFGPTLDRDRLLTERRVWLTDEPERHTALLPGAECYLKDVESLATEWGVNPSPAGSSPHERLLNLGRQMEPDLVLLAPDGAGRLKVVGGSVCFPSYWRLTDKLGHPVDLVHSPVPGLNASIGPAIDRYLSRMKPGSCWLRANFGLARQPDLNDHPDHGRHEWKRPLSLDQVWLRREDQALLSLPVSCGVLFGIRVLVRSVADVARSPEKARRLVRILRTMNLEMVRYKGFADVRDELIGKLDAACLAQA